MFTSEFKTKLVLELLQEKRTLGEAAADHQINPNQMANWRKEFLEKAPSIFDEPKTVKTRQKAERKAADEKDRLLKIFPNQVWAIDITYIPMKHGHMYLTAIIDLV
jgi:transposase-like protein